FSPEILLLHKLSHLFRVLLHKIHRQLLAYFYLKNLLVHLHHNLVYLMKIGLQGLQFHLEWKDIFVMAKKMESPKQIQEAIYLSKFEFYSYASTNSLSSLQTHTIFISIFLICAHMLYVKLVKVKNR